MFGEILQKVEMKSPLVHCITNYVTANDCANILLAGKASPIMADEIQEVEEVTQCCNSLVINMGTLSTRVIPSMLAAGKKARSMEHPIVLDPVGVGVSRFRKETADMLLRELQPTVIRGNLSEIKALAFGKASHHGVDAAGEENGKEKMDTLAEFAKGVARKTGAIIAITGAVDIVADHQKAFCIYNGDPIMGRVTGTGCQLSALTAAYVGVAQESPLLAVAAAVCAFGVCGEIARDRMGEKDGNASYRTYLIDAVYGLNCEILERNAKYDLR